MAVSTVTEEEPGFPWSGQTGGAGGRERGTEWKKAGPILSHKYSQFSITREKCALLVNDLDFIIVLHCLWPISVKERETETSLAGSDKGWQKMVGGNRLGMEGFFAFSSDFWPTRTAKGSVRLPADPRHATLTLPARMVHQILQVLSWSVQSLTLVWGF